MRISKKKIVAVAVVVIAVAAFTGYLYSLNGDSLDFGDTETRIVISSSMDGEPRDEYEIPTIPVGSMVFIHKVPSGPDAYDFYMSLEIGDVVTFDYVNPLTYESMVVTHRIVDIDHTSYGDIRFTMAGDSIRDDPTNSSIQVVEASSGDMIGKVVGVSPELGSLMIYLSSAQGKAVLIGLFAAIIVLIWVGPLIYRYVKGKSNKECE